MRLVIVHPVEPDAVLRAIEEIAHRDPGLAFLERGQDRRRPRFAHGMEGLAVALVVDQEHIFVAPIRLVRVALALVQVRHRGGDAVVIAGSGQNGAHPVEDQALPPLGPVHALPIAVRQVTAGIRVTGGHHMSPIIDAARHEQRPPLGVFPKPFGIVLPDEDFRALHPFDGIHFRKIEVRREAETHHAEIGREHGQVIPQGHGVVRQRVGFAVFPRNRAVPSQQNRRAKRPAVLGGFGHGDGQPGFVCAREPGETGEVVRFRAFPERQERRQRRHDQIVALPARGLLDHGRDIGLRPASVIVQQAQRRNNSHSIFQHDTLFLRIEQPPCPAR